MNDLLSRDRATIWHPFTPLPGDPYQRVIVRGEGALLFDADGNQIIDAISSWWVNIHGHANPTIAGAIAEQASQLEHVLFAGFTHQPAIEVAEKVLALAGPEYKKVFFSDNGSTAVEVALKLAIETACRSGSTRKVHTIVAFEEAYHGDTFGSMSISGRGIFTEPYEPYLFEVERIPVPIPGEEQRCFESYRKLLRTKEISICIFEPLVLGAGGMLMYSRESLETLVAISREYGVITIADEVMTGFGRTGSILATENLEPGPDLVCLSKGITGGFLPLAVTLCGERIVSSFQSQSRAEAFFHGHSYTGNPLACAAASASLDLLVEPRCEKQRELIEQAHLEFMQVLKSRSDVLNCRVTGTILAFEVGAKGQQGYLAEIRDSLYSYFLKEGALIRPLGNTVYLMPPYCITTEQLERCYEIILSGLDTI